MRLLLAAVFLCGSAAMAQTDLQVLEKKVKENPQDQAALLQLGIAYHDRAAGSDVGAIDKSAKYLRQIMQQDDKHPLAMAYLGSLHTIMGREAEFPQEKLSYVEDGIDLMDKAVKLAPENLRVRLVRAFNSYYLPDFFHRLQYAVKDLSYVIESGEFGYWPPEQQARVYFNLGLAVEKSGNAAKAGGYFRKTVAVAAESPWAAQAGEALQRMAGRTESGQGHE